MKKLFTLILSSICFISVFGQTTSLSFTSIPFSNADIPSPGRSAEEWNGKNTWDNATYIEVPNGTTHSLNYYFRFRWNLFEDATLGVYDWSAFDTQIQYAIDHGEMFSFGIMSVCSACGIVSTLIYPTYLHTLMQAEPTNSKDWLAPSGIWIPNWNSTNYLSRYKALLVALAAHIASGTYSGKNYRDVIYYVDLRGYGDFGEWQNSPYYTSVPTGRTALSASLDSLITMSLEVFPTYPNAIPIGAYDHGDASVIPLDVSYFALTQTNSWGLIGWRRDSWGEPAIDDITENNPYSYGGMNFDTAITSRYQYAPIVGELSSNQPTAGGTIYSDLPREFVIYGTTSFGNGNYYSNVGNAGLIGNIIAASKLSGYRLALTGGSMTTTLIAGGVFNITANWQNSGISPNYENWNVTYQLRLATTVVATWTSGFTPKLFLPSGSSTAESDNLTLTGVTAGTGYSLYIIIKDPTGYKAPLPLAITGRNVDGSYLIRTGITVANPVTGCNCVITKRGSQLFLKK